MLVPNTFRYIGLNMIITAINRSGATKFCLDKAEENQLKFIGQLDHASMTDFSTIDKIKYHETRRQEKLTFAEIITITNNHSDYVVLNNNITSSALFSQSAYFITRRNIKSSYFSLISFLQKQSPLLSGPMLRGILNRHTFQIGLIHTYLKMNNIIPLYFEDLFPESNTKYAPELDSDIQKIVNDCLTILQNNMCE